MRLREAMAGGGLMLFLVGVIVALIIGSYLRPAKTVQTQIVEPVGRSVGILPSVCPSGWTDTSDAADHIKVRSCMRDGWLVVLDQDGKFQHGVHLDTPGATFHYVPEEVPGWH